MIKRNYLPLYYIDIVRRTTNFLNLQTQKARKIKSNGWV